MLLTLPRSGAGPRLISDFLTIEELGDKMLAELARPK
jgi:hypothetical protein